MGASEYAAYTTLHTSRGVVLRPRVHTGPWCLRKHHWLTGDCWLRRHFQISAHFRLYHFRHLLGLTGTPSSPSVARRILLGPISNGHPSVPPEVSAAPGQENQHASDKMCLQIGNPLLEVSRSRWREHDAQPQGNTPPWKLKPRPPPCSQWWLEEHDLDAISATKKFKVPGWGGGGGGRGGRTLPACHRHAGPRAAGADRGQSEELSPVWGL